MEGKEYNFSTRFIGLAGGEINRRMPEFVREKVLRVLNEAGKAPSRSKILIMGVAYKKDLGDCRESPAQYIVDLLLKEGAEIVYHDPYVPEFESGGQRLCSEPLTEELVASADLVLIITEHSAIDYGWLVEKAVKIIDTRNVTKDVSGKEGKVVLL